MGGLIGRGVVAQYDSAIRGGLRSFDIDPDERKSSTMALSDTVRALAPRPADAATRRFDAVTFGELLVAFAGSEPGGVEQVSDYHRHISGAEVTVAAGLVRLGHRATWIGRVGDDPLGRYAAAALRGEGIDTSAVEVQTNRPTAVRLDTRAPDGSAHRSAYRSNSAGRLLAPSRSADEVIASALHVHGTAAVATLSESARAFALRAVERGRGGGATVSIDTTRYDRVADLGHLSAA